MDVKVHKDYEQIDKENVRCTIIQSTDKPISMLLTECWKYGKQKESQYSGLAEKRFTTGGCRTQMFSDRCSYRILWR